MRTPVVTEGERSAALLGPGTTVDTFRVTRLVAEGAMGQVYLAVDEQLGRRVALKFVKTVGLDAAALIRFRDEARTTARFSHPHIVTVYSAGVFEGRPWLALEYLDGQTLRERLDQGALPVPEALRVARAIAEGLAEAHRHDVVHADLKPENVVIPHDGRLRVVDFGLARLVGSEASGGSGTPAYMAPERWTGGAPRASIDVWALGVLLHEAIAGVRPFTEAELVNLAYSPKPVTLGPAVATSSCAALVAACLSIDPASRPSAEDIVQRLDRLLVGRDVPEGRSPFRGLEAFAEEDAQDLQGRGHELDAMVERLRLDPFVPVVGPSGVGKSSFVYAGLVPRLRASGWHVVSLRPGRRPWNSLASALRCEPEVLKQGAGGLVGQLRSTAGASGRVLLLIDQFEELITLTDSDERAEVLRALTLAASFDEPWRLVVTLRSDFLGAFAALPELTTALRAVQVLRPLGLGALEAAVRVPLQRVGYTPDDPELPRRIASELVGQSAALPLLQFACQSLWERRDAQRHQVLRREYDAMGGAVGALATHAQRLVSELLPDERRHTRALLLRLVNADGTRRPRTRTELLEGQPDAALQLDRLLQQRLLVSDRDTDDSEPLIELAHESLVSTWPQLERWLAETQEARSLTQDIEQAAQLWDKRGRDEEETWAREALLDALRRVDRWNISLTATPRAFLAAGRAREARIARRRSWLQVGAFTAISLVATVAAGAAVEFREQRREAVAQQEQIRLAVGDMGRFDLVLEPFDWDPDTLTRRAVSAERLPNLSWSLHVMAKDAPNKVGPIMPAERLRRSDRLISPEGQVVERVEAPSGEAVLEITGRGDCTSSSWIFLERLPGYAERTEPPVRVLIPVPTCAATHTNQARIELGDGGTVGFDRTELTTEAWNVYSSLSSLTRDKRLVARGEQALSGLPLVGVDAFMAERVCLYWGRRLPSLDEWKSTAAHHPQTLKTHVAASCVANLLGADDGFAERAPVGHCAGDVTTHGVMDLVGNVSEWTSNENSEGLRAVVGANYDYPADAPPSDLRFVNTRAPTYRDYGLGVRCASE